MAVGVRMGWGVAVGVRVAVGVGTGVGVRSTGAPAGVTSGAESGWGVGVGVEVAVGEDDIQAESPVTTRMHSRIKKTYLCRRLIVA